MPSKRQSKLASSCARDDVVVAAQGPSVEGERLLGKPEVLAKTGLSFVTIWRLMRRDSFPRSRQVASKAMWLGSEVDAWIAALPVVRLKGDPVREREDGDE